MCNNLEFLTFDIIYFLKFLTSFAGYYNKKLSKIKLPNIEGYEDVVVRFDWEK